MANMHLVTGYAGQEHVSSADQGILNATFMGKFQKVLAKGSKLAASVQTNNVVRVLDGDIFMQGRHIRLNENTYVDLTIENGQQGHKRNDLIVARYTKDQQTAIEEVNLVVIKGTAVDGEPSDPAYTEGNIYDGGAFLNDMPLYRVPLDGLNIGELVCLFSTFEDNLHDHTENGGIHVTESDKTNWNGMIPAVQKGAANGVATLDENQKIPSLQLPAGTFMPRKNLLDNPRFKVNQQGLAEYANSTTSHKYAVDRWRTYGVCSATLTEDGLYYQAIGSPSQLNQVYGFDTAEVDGKTCTISVLTDSGLYQNTFVFDTSKTLMASFDIGFASLRVEATLIMFYGNNYIGKTGTLKAVKLEIGEGQTLAYKDADGVWQLYDDYDYDEDLASCTFNHYQIEGGFLGRKYAYGVGAIAPRKNLLDNPRFRVNQQGLGSYSPGPTVDRWWISRAANAGATLTVDDNGVTVVSTGTSRAQFGSTYNVDFRKNLVGKRVTLSVLYQDGTLSSVLSSEITETGSATFATIGNLYVIGDTLNRITVSFYIPTGTTIIPRAIKLEEGEGQTLAYKDANGVWQLYDDYDYDQDLAACTINYFLEEGVFRGFDYATGIGAAKVEVGSYVGTGTYGPSNPNTLTFGFEPKAVFISVNSVILGPPTFIRGMESLVLFSPNDAMVRNGTCRLTWSGKTLTWHIDSGSEYGADVQYNAAKTYYYYAIG